MPNPSQLDSLGAAVRALVDPIERANRSARNLGAVGAKAVTPRYVAETLVPGETILNFGAGKPNPSTGMYDHSEMLRKAGGNVWEYDFGRNAVGDDALARQYDTVMASNVLNTQSDLDMLLHTLEQMRNATGQRAVFNFPASPRYMDATPDDVMRAAARVFGSEPRIVRGSRSAPLIEVRRP